MCLYINIYLHILTRKKATNSQKYHKPKREYIEIYLHSKLILIQSLIEAFYCQRLIRTKSANIFIPY
jgi:hypothetical protein